MTNAAAARTFNVLAGEGRRVVRLRDCILQPARVAAAQVALQRWAARPIGLCVSAWAGTQRIHRLAVVADLEMQHVARRAGAAHHRDLLAGLHDRAFVDQARTVVAVGRQPRSLCLMMISSP